MSQAPRLVKRSWPIESLSSKRVQIVFDRLLAFTSKKSIQQINFRRETSQGDWDYSIRKANTQLSREMMDGISEDMMNDMKRIGKKSFRIFLKPDPGQEEVGEVRDLKAGFVGGTKRIVF